MNTRGVDFLEVWIDNNVAFTRKPGDPAYARKLRDRLTAEAKRVGLTSADLHDYYDPDKYIMEALAKAPEEIDPCFTAADISYYLNTLQLAL